MTDPVSRCPKNAALVVFLASLVGQVTAVGAQSQDRAGEETGGVLTGASFEATFRKYGPPATEFTPVYSWDAHMDLNVTVVRAGSGRVRFRSMFQTVGTENLESQVSVGGTGYILGLGYVHDVSASSALSAGILHLSSHLTRDLDDKLDEMRSAGIPTPAVVDPSEYNVIYLAGYRKQPAWRFTPEFELIVEPVNFRFNGSPAGGVRPIYLGTRWTLWRSSRKAFVARTQHEIGENPFNHFSLSLELDGATHAEGGLQIFIAGSPGHQLHVSPNIGALRDGIAVGIRMAFRA